MEDRMSNTTPDLERAWLLQQLNLNYSTATTDDLLNQWLTLTVPGGTSSSTLSPSQPFPQVIAQLRTPAVFQNETTDRTAWTVPTIPATSFDTAKSQFNMRVYGDTDTISSGGSLTVRLRMNQSFI